MRKKILLGILVVMLLPVGCAQQQVEKPIIPTEPVETTSPTTETTDTGSAIALPAQTTESPQQTSELDMVKDVLRLKYVIDGYEVECISPSAFGLPGQLALLPNGDIVINDYTFKRLLLLSDNKLSTLVVRDDLWKTVAALPDGRICYSLSDEQLLLLDYIKGINEALGSTPRGDTSFALAADKAGNIYAATRQNNLYRFNADGDTISIATDLPFKQINQITDMDIASDGKIYIVGINRFVAIRPSGEVTIITDDLQNEPSWCEITPNDDVYIKEVSDIRLFDPTTGDLTPIQIPSQSSLSDFLAISSEDFLLFYRGSNMIYRYNLTTKEVIPVIINTINSFAFAASNDDAVFLATPTLNGVGSSTAFKSHIVRLKYDGTRQDLVELAFADIEAADVDKENRLCLYADGSFHRIEADGSIISFAPKFSSGEEITGITKFAVGPNGKWYCISTVRNESIMVWSVDETGIVNVLPITFDRGSFGEVYALAGGSIDVDDDGRLALTVTAMATKAQGPFYQHVYKADADGTNMTQVANLESDTTGGFVDITVSPQGDVFILQAQSATIGAMIYRITKNNEVLKFLQLRGGIDPKSIDVDSGGNVWFCTTVGVFRATRSR